MDIIKLFAANIRMYRQQASMTQEKLADKSGLHRTYISAIECHRRSISLENIQRLADALGVEVHKLFMLQEDGYEETTNQQRKAGRT